MYKHVYINSSKGPCICIVIQENVSKSIFVWPSSLVLSAYLVSNSNICMNQKFYEIGAGCGLPSLVAAKLGASKCSLTEKFDDSQLEILNSNIQKNSLEHICHAELLNWGSLIPNELKCDYILGADIFYSSEDFDSILSTVSSVLLNNPNAVFLTTYHQRR